MVALSTSLPEGIERNRVTDRAGSAIHQRMSGDKALPGGNLRPFITAAKGVASTKGQPLIVLAAAIAVVYSKNPHRRSEAESSAASKRNLPHP